jgi:membrane fusion protein, multidrug efflux system
MSEGGKSQDALDRWRAQSGEEGGKDKDGEEGGKDGSGEDAKPRKRRFYQSIWFKIAIVVIVIALIVGVILWWLNARQYEDTDDAFIDTHIIHIAPQISGQILTLKVNDNQLVRRGQLLAEINPQDTQAKLAQAQAQGLQAETQYEQALANQTAALASQRGAQAQAVNAASDVARYLSLQKTNPQAVAQQQVDQAVATDRNTRAQAANAAAQVGAAAAQVAGAKAAIKSAEAQIATARINLGYTQIFAPETGHVTQRSVALGNYVTPGQDLMTIVPLQLWVTANFKETQLALMRPGQPVTVVADACGDADVHGHVDSIQRGAGQAFGILPPENATGNYVKVVQRVPVKILLDSVPKNCTLGPGMSVEPTVKVR